MFSEIPDHIRKRHASVDKTVSAPADVPSLGSLDDLVLPARTPVYEIIPPEPEVRAAVLDSSAKLDELTNKALTRLDEILSEPLASDPKEMAVQMDAVRLTLTTQLRVDDSRLKKRENDTLAKLLAKMDEEDVKLMKVVNA